MQGSYLGPEFSNDEIKNFCEVNFGVKFDIFEKISVKGNDIHPIYKWLSNESENGWNNQVPTWTFSKYLINKAGNLVGMWGPKTEPQSKEITDLLNGVKMENTDMNYTTTSLIVMR